MLYSLIAMQVEKIKYRKQLVEKVNGGLKEYLNVNKQRSAGIKKTIATYL
jgi:hypothetical protein